MFAANCESLFAGFTGFTAARLLNWSRPLLINKSGFHAHFQVQIRREKGTYSQGKSTAFLFLH